MLCCALAIAMSSDTQFVEETGGGAQTRTADLRIMRPSL